MFRRIAPVLLLSALAVAACGGSTPLAGHPAPAGDQLPTAANGTDVEACIRGNCVVEVHAPETITLTGEGDVTTLTIDRIGPDGVDFTASGDDGSRNTGSIQGGCTLTLYTGGGGSSCGGSAGPPAAQTGVLALQLLGQQGPRAVLRLVAGAPGPPPASLVPPMPSIPVIQPPPIPTF